MKKECEIVRDLLPNYIENLVGTQTKDFINDHLKTCLECNKILKNIFLKKFAQGGENFSIFSH